MEIDPPWVEIILLAWENGLSLRVSNPCKELGERFIRVHRAYLAAADKIEAVAWKENKIRAGDRECLLSRAGKAKLRKKTGEKP